MTTQKNNIPQSIVIFGAGGDLCRRKLIPALYNLYLTDNLPQNFFITAIDYVDLKEETYKKKLLEGINEFSRTGKADKTAWKNFSSHIHYLQGDFTNAALSCCQNSLMFYRAKCIMQHW